jgi:hypothetical protein
MRVFVVIVGLQKGQAKRAMNCRAILQPQRRNPSRSATNHILSLANFLQELLQNMRLSGSRVARQKDILSVQHRVERRLLSLRQFLSQSHRHANIIAPQKETPGP